MPKITNAAVTVIVPKGCKKTHLSIDALDSYSRELADKTSITIGSKALLCRSFKLTDKGTLMLEVMPGNFEITEPKEKNKIVKESVDAG
jgi:hypothetical protein